MSTANRKHTEKGTETKNHSALTVHAHAAKSHNSRLTHGKQATDLEEVTVAGAAINEEKVVTDLTPEDQVTATEALARVRSRAMALREEDIMPYRVLPAVAIVNARGARAALARFRGEMPAALPKMDLTKFDELEDTALALVAAANDADKVSNDGEMLRNIAKARELRSRLLLVLHALAANGLLPMKVYKDIAAGSGLRDVAKDCVDLPAAFRQYAAAIAGKHPISDVDLAACDAVGTWLLRNISTKGARTQKGSPVEAVDLRNRVATILTQDYEAVSIMGYYFLGEGYAEVIPPLRSRFMPRRAVNPTSATSPVLAPTQPPQAAPVALAPGVPEPMPAQPEPSTPREGSVATVALGTSSIASRIES